MIKRVLVVGDNHLSSSNRSNHTDYANESLDCLKYIVDYAENNSVSAYIDLGDLSYGKFELGYRAKVEDLYIKRTNIVQGNCFSSRGNHDMSNKGISEWEYYTKHRKLLNSEELCTSVCDGYRWFDVYNVRFHIIDYGHEDVTLNLKDGGNNFVCAHNFFKFKDSNVPNFGKAIDLDFKEEWFGIDAILCGHIHHNKTLSGHMLKDGHSREVFIYYPGSIVRTDFTQDLPSSGEFLCIDIDDNDNVQFNKVEIPWIPEEDAFQLGDIIKEKKKVDISDIVKSLNDRERTIGNPETVIHNMGDFEQKYKDKAIELLREA